MADDHHIAFTDDDASVHATADFIERELTDPDDCVALPIPNGTAPIHRMNLISHHGAVIRELRRRGFPVEAYTEPKPDGAALVIARASSR